MTAIACLLADESTTTYFVFNRLQSLTQWWHWLALLLVCGLIAAAVASIYRRDNVEVRRAVGWTLVLLRLAALLGVLFYFLDLERRSERRLVKNSRVAVLVDTSQSMGLKDRSPSATGAAGEMRIREVVDEFRDGDLLERLRADHDVVVYAFDQSPKPTEIAAYPRARAEGQETEVDLSRQQRLDRALVWARTLAWVAGGLATVALVSLAVFGLTRGGAAGGEATSWSLLVTAVALIAAVVVLATASLRHPDVGPLVALGLREPALEREPDGSETEVVDGPSDAPRKIDWEQALLPRGVETRLGEAVTFLVEQERGGPIAGVIVISDGRSNAGVDYTSAIAAARDARIPVHGIGVGSDRQPLNVRVVDVDAPRRIYPGDKFTMTGYLQSFGIDARSVKVELLSRPVADAGASDATPYVYEDEQRVDLKQDGEVMMVKFETRPNTEQGRIDYKVRVVVPNVTQDEGDDEKSARVEVVDRRAKVLLLAGGPSREFRFLRDQLFRDDEVTSNVLLQTAQQGASQEADKLLFEFPEPAELFEYDCIVAFDPDWMLLDQSSIDALEQWVAEKAGGLIVVAGPVHTASWANRRQRTPAIGKLRSLYPVVLYQPTSAALTLGRFGSAEAWPLRFTRDGTEAEFLWLEEDSLGNEAAWSSFAGVYGYYAVREPKPGAQVYARFSDPSTSIDDELPIYMASHFYGAGRVFFQASGEMWRIREVNDAYFVQYYTKLIRWVSQGRLLRDSSQGVLIVDKERCLIGDQVGVRAILTDERHEPLTKDEVPAVLLQPDGTETALTLRLMKDAARPGMYSGQFAALSEGDYRIELQTLTGDAALLTQEVRARVPQLEVEQPERNDPLMKDLTDRTGGAYYIGVDAAMNRDGSGRVPLLNLIDSQDQTVFLPGTPDTRFEESLMAWLMGLICGALCLEWLIRRLSKLA